MEGRSPGRDPPEATTTNLEGRRGGRPIQWSISEDEEERGELREERVLDEGRDGE